jgi:hypothetical protein
MQGGAGAGAAGLQARLGLDALAELLLQRLLLGVARGEQLILCAHLLLHLRGVRLPRGELALQALETHLRVVPRLARRAQRPLRRAALAPLAVKRGGQRLVGLPPLCLREGRGVSD